MKNKAASIRTRLLNLSREEKKDFVLISRLYMQEGILRRIGQSKYSESFYLKGGLLLYSISGFTSRPTMDIDLLGLSIPNDSDRLQGILSEILSIQIEDGLSFETESMSLQEITEGADYHGQRLKVLCRLGSVRTNLKLDIGFGDIIFPEPVKIDYPLLLDSEKFSISAYSLESVIAEKFEAMIVLDIRNSRMKDFYDVYDILTNKKIDAGILREAIRQTFERRHTVLPQEPAVFQESFVTDTRNLQLWKAFLNRIKAEQIDFPVVIQNLREYLFPIYQELKGSHQ